jgi:hypothetical protein
MANWVYLQVRISLLFFGIRISFFNLKRRDVEGIFGVFPEDAGDFIAFNSNRIKVYAGWGI